MASDGDFSRNSIFEQQLDVPKAHWVIRLLASLWRYGRPVSFLLGAPALLFMLNTLAVEGDWNDIAAIIIILGAPLAYLIVGILIHLKVPRFSPLRLAPILAYVKVSRSKGRWARRIRRQWISIAVSAGLVRVESLFGFRVPPLLAVVESVEGISIYVRVPRGGSAHSLVERTPNIASAIGVRQLLATQNNQLCIKLVVPARDALQDTVTLSSALKRDTGNAALDQSLGALPVNSIAFGTTASSDCISIPLDASQHYAFQGQARSGKSVSLYGFLSQLREHTNWRITGIDPTGALPAASDEIPWVLAGENGIQPSDVARWLDAVETVLNRRLAALRRDQSVDKFESDDPIYAVQLLVLEELPSVLKSLKVAEAGVKPADRVTDRLKAVYGRLMMEALKVNIRVLTIAQRADAEILGGAERAQIACRVTYKVDNQDAVRMFHDGVSGSEWDQLRSAAPGVGIIEQIGQSRTLFRAYSTSFTEYRRIAGPMPEFEDASAEGLV
ncbi:hypothetical protein [Glutamicibacter arilaitensis]|uniref:hypothetical protein n=1 Tax=Glutamicibacter arilaitensis TaxID=256701 RepID=UPI003F965CA6